MREIEVKARLGNRIGFLLAAKRYGIFFGEPVQQDDTIFAHLDDKLAESDSMVKDVVRLRKTAGKVLLTLKYRASDQSRDNHELETEVSSYQEMTKIFERMGWHEDIRINKHRQTAAFKGFELCVDALEGVGDFVEIEKLAKEEADAVSIQAEMWKILTSLGVAEEDRVHDGYYTLLRKQREVAQAGVSTQAATADTAPAKRKRGKRPPS